MKLFHDINPYVWAMRDRNGVRWPGFHSRRKRLAFRLRVLIGHLR